MKWFFKLIIFIFVLVFPNFSVSAQMVHTETVDYLYFDPIIVDSHVDTMMHVIEEESWLPKLDIGGETSLQLDIPKAQEGGLDVAFFAAYTSGYLEQTPRSVSRTLALLNALYSTEKKNAESLQIASHTEEITQVVEEGKIAAVPSIEGAYSLDEHNAIELLNQYYDLGVKVIGFNWNYSNALGEGASRVYGDLNRTPSTGGLTELGAQVVKEMNRLGMVVDVSHMSRETFSDVIKISKAPIIASHSGVFSLKEHPRNLTDEEMLALKENGGVLSIVFFPAFLTDYPTGYVTDIVDHIDYTVDLMGIDHVGIGSDFDGAPMPVDLKTAADLQQLTEELAHRGYSLEDIEKLLGGNILRVLEEVEQIAEIDGPEGSNRPNIKPEYDMGEIIHSRTPVLQAQVDTSENLDLDSLRVIVDGIVFDPAFDEDTATISLAITEDLHERFHVVTFETATETGITTRESRIFYIKD